MLVNETSTEALANKLYELFVANPIQYAKQLDDGNYNTIYKHLYPSKIKNVLENKGSILTYQEAQGYLKWICLDFDIKKEFKDQYDQKKNDLKLVIKITCEILSKLNIDYLLECSGNRGFHIWIIFENTIKKSYGYAIAESICNKIGVLPESIAIDCYPKTYEVNMQTKGLGLGVKLPLSFHRKSLKYSFIVESVSENTFDKNTWPTSLNDSFICSQYNRLCKYSLQNSNKIINLLQIDLKKYEQDIQPSYIRINNFVLDEKYSLENVLKVFRKCKCLKAMLSSFQSNLTNQERLILVGLFSRLTIKDDDNYGLHLLHEIFSQLPNYDVNKTTERLAYVKNFFPPTCDYLKSKIKIDCKECICEGKTSPIELLSDVEIAKIKWYDVSETLFNNVLIAEKNYTYFNDEVPLYHIEQYIRKFRYTDFINKYKEILDGNYTPNSEIYNFIRNEGNGKERVLVTISPEDKILSAIALNHIHSFWNDVFSSCSYGYRMSDSYCGGYIFESWLTLWKSYIKNVKDIIEDEESAYDNYHLIKIDLKGFYDNINHQHLRIKLLDDPIADVAIKLKKLSSSEKLFYQNIVNYLICLCKKTNSEKGVPQGPAFARYLAEIYLISIDNLVSNYLEKGHEFYFRYVDDIFIFIKDNNRKDNIFKMVLEHLSINNLELNTSKSLQMTVKQFKEQKRLQKYSDESKYFIDQTLKHASIATKGELAKATKQAYQLLQNSKWGIKDDYRFIYNHFFSDSGLIKEKILLEKDIILATEARGSLFTIFFDDYFFKKEPIMFVASSQIDKMNRLSFECYLNSLLRINLPQIKESIIIHIKELLLKLNIHDSKVIRISLLQLALKYGVEVNKNFIDGIDGESLNIVLSSPEIFNIHSEMLTDEMFSKIFPLDLTFNNFIERINNITYFNKFDLKGLNNLSKYFWARSAEKDNIKDNKISLNKLYNLLCLYSITIVNIGEVEAAIQKIWNEFFLKFNAANETINLDWFYHLPENELDKLNQATLAICITLDQEGGLLDFCDDRKYGLLNKFREIILTIISSEKELITKMLEDQSKMHLIISKLRKNNMFIEWIYDVDARLFPNREQCFSNIAFNNLVAMNKNNNYLVKSLDDKISKFDYLPDITSHDQSIVTFSKNNNFNKIEEQIHSKYILDAFKKIIKLYNAGNQFKSKYSCNYPNYFHKDVYVNDLFEPHMAYYASCKFLISNELTQLKNDEENFCYLIINKFIYQNIEVFPGRGTSYHYIFNKDNIDYFFPINIRSDKKKIDFIIKFNEISQAYDSRYFSYHSFEKSWAETLLENIKNNSSVENEIIYHFFESYIYHHAEKRKVDPELYHLIFSIEKTQPNNNTIETFFNTIFGSISIEKIRNCVIELKNNLLAKVEKHCKENVEKNIIINLSDFKIANIDIINKKNPGQSLEIFEIKNNNELLFSETSKINLFVYEFGKVDSIQPFVKENMKDILDNKTQLKYILRLELMSLILIIPRELQKVYESIEKRRKWFEEWDSYSNMRDVKLLFNYEDVIINVADNIDDAARKIVNHYYPQQSDKLNEAKERIINWLLLFNDVSLYGTKLKKYMDSKKLSIGFLYKAILEVVCHHDCVENNDIERFKENFTQLKAGNNLFFSLKSLNDANGLYHLLSITDSSFTRDANFTDCYQKIVKKNRDCGQLVILCDVGITGIEIQKALNFYLKNEFNKTGELSDDDQRNKILNEQRYYNFSPQNIDEWNNFKNNFTSFSKVTICSTLVTDDFKKNVHKTITALFKEFGNSNVNIDFKVSRTIKNYHYSDKNIHSTKSDIFEKLILDKELIQKLFHIPNWDKYKDTIQCKRYKELHLILRLQSTPQKRFSLFTLIPKDTNIKSLFDRRKEHIF